MTFGVNESYMYSCSSHCSQSRQTSAESADSRFLSLAVVPLGEDGGLQLSARGRRQQHCVFSLQL
jgi:hypothetical protein